MQDSQAAASAIAPAPPAQASPTASGYEAFAQDPYYLAAWGPRLGASAVGPAFNWSAAVFGMTWCFYRKMYGVGLLLPLAFFALAFVGAICLAIFVPDFNLVAGWRPAMLAVGAALPVRVTFGFMANGIYFRKATRAIEQASASGVAANELPGYLNKVGGVSEGALVVSLVLGFLLNLLARLL